MSIFEASDQLEDITDKLEFLFSSIYATLHMSIKDDMVIKNTEVSGFWKISEEITDQLRSVDKSLRTMNQVSKTRA